MTDAYQVDWPLPELLEKGRDNVVTLPVRRSGAAVVPSVASVSLYNEADQLVVADGVATISGGVASYTISSATLATESLSEGWRIVWSATIAGTAYTFDNEAALVRRRLFPVVDHQVLYGRVSRLDPDDAAVIHKRSDFEGLLQDAWVQIQQRLIEAGRRPWLIVSPSSLREATLQLWLHLIYDDLAHGGSDDLTERAETHAERYESAWAKVRFKYDEDDDGDAEHGGRLGVSGTLWLA